MPNNIDLHIRLDKIPADKIKRFQTKDGETGAMIVLTLAPLRQKNKFGNSHTIYLKRTKSDRDNNTPPIYCGNGKEFVPKTEPVGQNEAETVKEEYPY